MLKKVYVLIVASFFMMNMNACKNDSKLTMMTQNLYLGADISRLIKGGEGNDPVSIWRTVQYTRFQDRAVALAKTMARHKPHVIALQEVSHYTIALASNGYVLVDLSFQDVLMGALEAQGLHYRAVARSPGVDRTFPASLPDVGDVNVRYQGYNLLLVDPSIEVSNTVEGEYNAQLSLPLGDGTVTFTRGYTVSELKKGGVSFAVANTHLELHPSIQLAQAGELMEVVKDLGTDTFVMGDINSAAPNIASESENTNTATYTSFLEGGFRDAFLDVNADSLATSTCCFSETLDEEKGDLSEGRIDHILYRRGNNSVVTKRRMRVFFTGNKSTDKTPGSDESPSLWPSDHLGVVMELNSQKAKRTPIR